MMLTVYAESQLASLVAESEDDAFILGKLSSRIPKSIHLKTKEGRSELQVDIMDMVKLVTE